MAEEGDDVFADEEPEDGTESKPVVKEAEKTPQGEATPPKDEDLEAAGLRKALIAERHKRQEAESKLKEKEKVPEVVPDPVTDPDLYTKYVLGKGDANILRLRIEQSQELMRDANTDYDEVEKVFISLITDEGGNITDPKLVAQFNSSKNPAKFAYTHAKKHLDYVNKTSDDYEAKLRKQIADDLLAKFKAKGLDALDLPNLTNAAASDSNTIELEKYKDDSYLWKDD